MSYPETIDLPFNNAAIKNDFIPLKPGEGAPEGPGFWLVLQGSALVVRAGADCLCLPEGERPDWLDPGSGALCIGIWQGKPLWATNAGTRKSPPPPFITEQFNAVEERLDDRLLTLGGIAHQILHWEGMSAVCSRCGGELERIAGTWGKKCRSCCHEHFPSIHPCAIVLVKRVNEFLLVRKAAWQAGRYSLVAGFVDPGESLEECVHREVREEAGIAVTNLRYVGSQNWPFPSQLMAGFLADYAGGELRADESELEDASWFCRERMPGSLPAKRSIARWIIDRYALGL